MRIYAFLTAAVTAALLAIIYAGGSKDSNTARAAELLPVCKTTQGQLQVIDKEGKPVGQCPLKHTYVSAEVSGFVARVDVTQEFVNPLDEKIEAVYVFPLPQDSAVDRMEMTIGERTIRGEIKRREEAREIYEKAKQQGQAASLLDQERPNIFTQSVANILPGQRILIKISYVDLLKYESGQYEFTFPMVVGPRYIPGQATGKTGEGWAPDTDKVPDASKITPPVTPEGTRAGHDISLEVKIHAGVPIGEIKSVLHEIETEREDEERVRVRLRNQQTIPNKDFILRYQVAGRNIQTGLLPSTRSAGDGHFSFILVPPAIPKPNQITPKEMIFVIDTSGSQMGWPIEKSKETMSLCIDQMNPEDTFQMLAFNNDVVSLFDRPQPNTPENRALAHEFLSSKLGRGGTEMLKAVLAALTPPPDPKRLRIVCFMTDGYVGNDFEILDAVKKNLGNARLFSFGIGNAANRFLLDGMADMGRGAVQYVTLAEKGDEAVKKFCDRISTPVFTDIHVDWGNLPVSDFYPELIPDLFSSQPVIIKGRYHGESKGIVTVSGKIGGKLWRERVEVTLPNIIDENQALPSLWARSRIAELMKKDYQAIQHDQPDPKIKEEIIRTALDYQLMSRFTSFVAVEERIVTKDGQPKKVTVPVEMPEGVSYEGVFGIQAERRTSSAGYAGTLLLNRSEAPWATNAVPASPAVTLYRSAGDPNTPAQKKAYIPETPAEKVHQLLKGLSGKLDKKGNYSGPDKLQVKDGKTKVSIRLKELSPENLQKLKKLGFEIKSSSASLGMVIGILPVKKLEEISKLEFVVEIKPA